MSIEPNRDLAVKLFRERSERFCHLIWTAGVAAVGVLVLLVSLNFVKSVAGHSLGEDGLWPTLSGLVTCGLAAGAFAWWLRAYRQRNERFIQEARVVRGRIKPEQAEVFTPLYEPFLIVARKTVLKPFLRHLPMETCDYEVELSGQKRRYQDNLFEDEILFEGDNGLLFVLAVPQKAGGRTSVITRRSKMPVVRRG